MIDAAALTGELKSRVSGLVDDLRSRADEVPEVAELVHAEWLAASEAGRTAHDEETWREDLLAQVAVSWVLGTVFIRFCEDNGLLSDPLISGPGDWRRWANDAQLEFFRQHPADGERAFLVHVLEQAAELPGLGQVFGEHNPLWRFGPSDDACRSLIELWRQVGDDGGLVWDFADPEWGTRFLGDLYQDLSEHAKKTYALLQTPDFVEEFILDRTLEPALDEFGLAGADAEAGFGLIDPACGSGHFLLGAFARLAERHLAADRAAGRRAAAARALGNVFGVDLNPFAASIARFRLLVAALRFAEVSKLAEAPVFDIQIAVGDSLLHGPSRTLTGARLPEIERSMADTAHLYATEDAALLDRFLGRRFEAVVANPPYITVKDKAANAGYRDRWPTCHRTYSLAVPFMERIFDLAYRAEGGQPAGFTGQITANSFMKREFGKKLIEDFLASEVDLTHVIDTSGAYIPGHGTPTVILFGRNRVPVGDELRAVLGIRGEPSPPLVPSEGLVWSSIERLIDRPGTENDYVSIDELKRERLADHPWSLQGGAAGPLKAAVENDARRLEEVIAPPIGRAVRVGADDVFECNEARLRHSRLDRSEFRALLTGEGVRDWCTGTRHWLWYPYAAELPAATASAFLWRWRVVLAERATFQGVMADAGLDWFAYMQHTASAYKSPLSISFAYVATLNHYVLDRGGRVFNRHAPVIKLPEGTSEAEHLQLLGLLNSAVACFWMKQVFHNKGDSTDSEGARVAGAEGWIDSFEFDGTKLKSFPLAAGDVLPWSEALDQTAQELTAALPSAAADAGRWDEWLDLEAEVARLRARMVWLQEELDWRCAFLYGVTDRDLSFGADRVFELEKGQRAFEIALAGRMAAGEVESSWFERHGSEPITELPSDWPDWYRGRVEERLALTQSDRFVKLLERPEYKRRWNWDSWDDLATEALAGWLATRLEDARYWAGGEPRSVNQLADSARTDEEFMRVAELYRGSPDIDVAKLVGELTKPEAVPFLAALRYKPAGLRKRASWEKTWELQRREDAGEDVGKIPVPPKYGSGDFVSSAVWKLRGKLDVPKERFVSYPGAEREADSSPVLGWAGWNHLEQAQALVGLFQQRSQDEGWDVERLVPILAGVLELVPWLKQWHNEPDPSLGMGLGVYYESYLTGELARLGLTEDDLRAWRPPASTRGRKKKATT